MTSQPSPSALHFSTSLPFAVGVAGLARVTAARARRAFDAAAVQIADLAALAAVERLRLEKLAGVDARHVHVVDAHDVVRALARKHVRSGVMRLELQRRQLDPIGLVRAAGRGGEERLSMRRGIAPQTRHTRAPRPRPAARSDVSERAYHPACSTVAS